ncbi:hypothetical protein JKF63_05536 [Porcisia hertigi]|uniref:Uncharacterized protein n=1 Tax=Porcisia hertigi TaxID=2761500 RepID=A0A836IU86_9TRYP|nr:hypothetical protein JKF63_01552 [Porcisia hertigi]KAG5503398.1 hypothetical protein JKF63_05536 [Porcisia hertigi]
MERPYRISLPASVDTLAELCQYLTARLPLRPAEDTTGRGYRFLYTITGKPLWRVKECIDARTIVVSVGPGFLARRLAGLTAGPPPAAPATSVVDITSDTPATQSGIETSLGEERSPSASPPIKQPADVRYNTSAGGDGRAYCGSADYYSVSITPRKGHTAFSTSLAGSAAGKQASVDVAWPPDSPMPRPSQTDARGRLLSITLSTAMRGRASSGEGPMSSQTPPELNGLGVTPHLAEGTPADRLFASAVAAAGPAPPNTSTAGPRTDVVGGSTSHGQAESPGAPRTTTASTSRGMVFLSHRTFPLPPRPAFVRASSPTGSPSVLQLHQQPLTSTSTSSSLDYFLLRKWAAYQRLHNTSPIDLVAGEALSLFFNTLTPKSVTAGGAPCRVLVSGPPRSGVSTTASLLVRHYLWTLQFQSQHPFHNSVLLVLDFHLLFGPATTAGVPATPPSPLLLDLCALYQLIVRSVIDAVVAQRPALRGAEQLLAQLWDLVIKPNAQPPTPPDFTTFSQAAALVGVEVLSRWTRLAQEMYPILQAACRTPAVPELRSAAIDLIFYAIPAELASSLNFSGLFYVLDGLAQVAGCYADRLTRPAGDLGPLLQAITADPRTHLLIAWPSTLSPQTIFLPGLTAHVSTIGLVTRSALNMTQFPQVLRCREREYPLEVFLGCPGYLSILLALAKPFRKTLSIPTTAFSAFYQQNYTKHVSRETDGYALRVDTPAAASVLDALLQLVQTLPLC